MPIYLLYHKIDIFLRLVVKSETLSSLVKLLKIKNDKNFRRGRKKLKKGWGKIIFCVRAVRSLHRPLKAGRASKQTARKIRDV